MTSDTVKELDIRAYLRSELLKFYKKRYNFLIDISTEKLILLLDELFKQIFNQSISLRFAYNRASILKSK
jgi:hypothetical protein